MSIKLINKHQRGFSLTELMVAMVVGLVILAGVSSVMVSNKKTYTAQDSLARLQENARAAMLILTRDMRNIGYWGCNPDMENVHSALKSANSVGNSFWFGDSIEGSEAGGPLMPTATPMNNHLVNGKVPRNGTDVFLIRGLDTGDAFKLEGKMNNEAASLKILDTSPFQTGEVLVITDCNSADIFQVNNITGGSGFDNLVHNAQAGFEPGNATGQGGKLSKAYSDDATIMRYKANTYFIAPGASNEPSLWRQTLVTSGSNYEPATQELVEGIENLQVLYGVDTDNDKLPDVYRTANLVGASTWSNVVAIRFGIIARALANLQTSDLRTSATASQLDTKALDIDGDGVNDFTGTETTTTTTGSGKTVKDRQYQRRMFRTTVLLRNMQARIQ